MQFAQVPLVIIIKLATIRGVARIFQEGVQFAEMLLTTPTLKTTPIYS